MADQHKSDPSLALLNSHFWMDPVTWEPEWPTNLVFGRENEVAQVWQLFNDCRSEHLAKFMLITGPAGIGKSQLLSAAGQQLSGQISGFYVGKYDQFRNHVPFSALSELVRSFLQHKLNQERRLIDQFRSDLLALAGDSLMAMQELVPQFNTIVGAPRVSTEISQGERLYHLLFSMKALLQLATADQPVVLLLEDLQWADSGSLKLISQLLDQSLNLPVVFLATCRTEALPAGHPTLIWMKDPAVPVLEVQPLDLPAVQSWLASLQLQADESRDQLAQICLEKSRGNPLYIAQYLHHLKDQSILQFSAPGKIWRIQLDLLFDRGTPDDMTYLIHQRLATLEPETVMLLKWAACRGHLFQASWLQRCTSLAAGDIHRQLNTAIGAQLLKPHQADWFQFAHDRIQQILKQQVEPSRRQEIERIIGFDLARQLGWPDQARQTDDEQLLEAADLLLAGQVLSDEPPVWSLLDLIAFYQAAGKKSLRLLDPSRALLHFKAALAMLVRLPAGSLPAGLEFDVLADAVTAAYRSDQVSDLEQLTDRAMDLAADSEEQVRIAEVWIEYLTTENRYREAFKQARTLLKRLDIRFPEEPTALDVFRLYSEVCLRMGRNPAHRIRQLPAMAQGRVKTSVRLLAAAGIAAYSYSGRTFMLLLLLIVKLSLKEGVAPETPVALAAYGQFLASFLNQRREGYAFGQLAVDLQQQMTSKAHACKTFMLFEIILRHQCEPLADTLNRFPEIHELGLATGDLSSAGHAMMQQFVYLFLAGRPLPEVIRTIEQYRPVLLKTRDQKSIAVSLAFGQLAINTQAGLPQPWILDGPSFQESASLDRFKGAEGYPVRFNVFLTKMIAAVLADNWQQAVLYYQEAELAESGAIGTYVVPAGWFYGALALYAHAITIPDGADRRRLIREAKVLQRRLQALERDNPANYANKLAFLKAEHARAAGALAQSLAHYNQAIEKAGEQGFLPEQALACERAAAVAVDLKLLEQGINLLQKAREICQNWSASGWLARLDQKLETTSPKSIQPANTLEPLTLIDQQIDLETLFKANRAISEEIILSELLLKMIDIALKNAGANLAVFISETEQGLVVEAAGTASGRHLPLTSGQLVRNIPELLEKAINFAINTRSQLVLQTAQAIQPYLADPSIVWADSRSVLCLPILSRQHLNGLLYLENDLMGQAFTDRQLEILKVITSQLAISIDNARLYQSLEQIVEQRTHQLIEKNAQLALANSQLAEASQAKDQFLANVSHEIRTPLQGIIGLSNLLERSLPDVSQQSTVKAIQDSAGTLLRMMNELLDFSKYQAGKMQLVMEQFSLHALLSSILPGFVVQAEEKGLAFNQQIASDLIDVLLGDPHRLGQILTNLLSNAIKFTEQGQVRLVVHTTSEGNYVRLQIEVADTGIGMTADLTERIFDDFVQGDASTTRRYGGTGLGLPITRQIVDQMGGSIHVASQPGQGSQFVVELLLQPGAQVAVNVIDQTVMQQTARSSLSAESILNQEQVVWYNEQLKGFPVLLGEDDLVSRMYFSALLGLLGCSVEVAQDGQAILDALAQQTYGCLVLDKNMPLLDGLAVTKQIREKEMLTGGHLPILALTASALAGERERLLAAGVDDYLSKPVNERLFAERLLLARLRAHVPVLKLASLQADIDLLGSAIFVDVIDELIRELPSRIDQIETAIGQLPADLRPQDPKSLLQHFHKLAGTVSVFHAEELSNRLKSLEQQTQASEWSQVACGWPVVRARLLDLIEVLYHHNIKR